MDDEGDWEPAARAAAEGILPRNLLGLADDAHMRQPNKRVRAAPANEGESLDGSEKQSIPKVCLTHRPLSPFFFLHFVRSCLSAHDILEDIS